MAVTITPGSLSTNAKYLSYGASDAATDAKTHVIAISDILTAMNWTRFDNAGAAAVLGTDDDAMRIFRRATSDNASSGHYQYLAINISQGGTANSGANYRVQWIYSADWTDAGSKTAYVNPIRLPHGDNSDYWKNDAAGPYVDTMLGYNSAGTLWIMNAPFLTTFVFTSAAQINDGTNVFVFGEYDKSFGEQMPLSSEFLHNGIAFNGREFADHSGAPAHSSASWFQSRRANDSNTGVQPDGDQQMTYMGSWPADTGPDLYSTAERTYHVAQRGESRPQFLLTEYPTSTNGLDGSPTGRGIDGTPEAWNNSYVGGSYTRLATRLHMGWLGWIGHLGPIAYSLSSFAGTDLPTATDSNAGNMHQRPANSNTMFSSGDDYGQDNIRGWFNSYNGKGIDSHNDGYVIYEPSVSVGHSGRVKPRNRNYNYSWRGSAFQNTYYPINIQTATGRASYAGTNVKFSVFGRIRNFKMSFGFSQNFLAFLDAATIPQDANGFFQSGGTDTDHWGIPLNAGATVVMWIPK